MRINLFSRLGWLGCAFGAVLFTGQLASADLLIFLSPDSLDASGQTWTNNGTLGGTFNTSRGTSSKSLASGGGVLYSGNAVAGADVNGTMTSSFTSVASVEGAGNRTVESWVLNPTFDSEEETLIGWGGRGGPTGTNMAFNYTQNSAFGSLATWGADVGFDDWSASPNQNPITDTPAANLWHHLAWVYNGTAYTLYADGQSYGTYQPPAVDTRAGGLFHLGGQNNQNGSLDPLGALTLSLNSMKVYNEARSANDIIAAFQAGPVGTTAIPEPTSAVLISLVIGTGVLTRRRR